MLLFVNTTPFIRIEFREENEIEKKVRDILHLVSYDLCGKQCSMLLG